MRHLSPILLLLALVGALRLLPTPLEPASNARAETHGQRGPATLRIATWNVENWRHHFTAWRRRAERNLDDAAREALLQERFQNDEDNWEIAQVLTDSAFIPDILVFQEGPAQEELEEFNKQWLSGMYESVQVFPSNDDRGQTIGILLKPGFRVVAREDEYHKLPDPQDLNPRTDFLFARGPAFVLVETPRKTRLWVGTNHQKSKGGGNDVATTRWRNAEAAATRKIMTDLIARGPAELVFLGDMNDEPGIQAYELDGGGDVMATLICPPEEGLRLATRELTEQGQASYMGYWRADYRSLIDHIVLSRDLADQVRATAVFDSPWARVASDHLPVYVDVVVENVER